MDGVQTTHHRVPYLVVGFTAAQLRMVLAARGPVRAGRHFAAFTDWRVGWRYRVEDQGQHCRIAEVAVDVSIQTVIPQWEPPRSAPASLVAGWDAFVSALELHERGHADIARGAGERVRTMLLTLPTFQAREALDDAAAAAAQAALRDACAMDEKYDAETGHGRSQGARFPDGGAQVEGP